MSFVAQAISPALIMAANRYSSKTRCVELAWQRFTDGERHVYVKRVDVESAEQNEARALACLERPELHRGFISQSTFTIFHSPFHLARCM